MKWTKQRLNNLFFVVGVVAVVVMILTFDVSFAELWQHLTHAGYWLIPIIGVWLLVYGLNALAWKSIIKSCSDPGEGSGDRVEKVSPWRIYRLTITGYALNYATPVGGLGGEPYRIMELSKNIGNQRATSSVILYAMMHFFAHFWLWFTSIFLYLALALVDYVPMTPVIGALMCAAIAFCLVAFYVFSKGYKHGLVVKLIRWIGKIPGLKGWSSRFQERHAEALQNIDKQIASLHKQDKRSFYYSLFMEYASRIVQSLEILFMLLLFGIDCGGGFEGLFFTFLYSVLILSFTTLVANLIGFLPMQLGVQEGGFMLSIALIGMSTKLGSDVDSAALGIFVSIICRVREIIWIAIGMLLMKIDDLHLGRKVAMVLFAVLSVVGMSSCSHDDDSDPAPDPWTTGKADRTVLVYMAGENNLTAYAGYRFLQHDFNEMLEASRSLTDKQRLLVFVDSLSGNVSDSIPKGTPIIVELHGGQVYPVKRYPKEFYSCDPQRFQEVLQTMVDTADADSYGLVLWGHASGWLVSNDSIAESVRTGQRAYGLDYGTDGKLGGSKWMNITQMARAIEGLRKDSVANPFVFEFVFADCCNMMCAEVGYELRKSTKYLMGSPSEIPGEGAPYDKIVSMMYENDTEKLCRDVIDTYYDYYLDASQYQYYNNNWGDLTGYSLPMSVIETRYMGDLAEATRDVLSSFIPDYPQYYNPFDENNRIGFYFLDSNNCSLLYDLRAIMKVCLPEEQFEKWDAVYQLAVPYYRMSMRWMTIYGIDSYFDRFMQDESAYGCLSVHIPQNRGFYDTYNNTSMQFGWHQVLDWSRFAW